MIFYAKESRGKIRLFKELKCQGLGGNIYSKLGIYIRKNTSKTENNN